MQQRVILICAIVLLGAPVSIAGSRHAQSPSNGGMIERGARESGNSLYQVFPLAPRLHYVYDYRSYFSQLGGTMQLQKAETDTGLVEYTILDSSLASDSTVIWTVQEVSALWDSVWEDSTSVSVVRDTATDTLQENLSGLHRLTMSGKVWNFPSTDSGLYVFRYSDSPNVVVYGSLNDPGNGNTVPAFGRNDSLFLSKQTGPTRLYSSSGGGFSPEFSWSQNDTATMVGQPVLSVETRNQPPTTFVLEQNYPNPFNPTTVISYQLSAVSHVTLTVYDVLGRRVKTLVDKVRSPGSYEVRFDGAGLSSGVYFYRIDAEGNGSQRFVAVKKLMLVK